MAEHDFGWPLWYRRVWFWSSDDQYEYTEWLEKRLGRGLPKLWEWQEKVEKSIAWLGCGMFGHYPIADCHIPEHDFCCYCRKSMPGQAPRSAPGARGQAENETEEHGND